MEKNIKKLSLEPYKGTRDFYPKDQFVQNYIFSVWKKVAESYGYLEYGSSILEETDLYRAKSGEEIINDQTYSFTDRGGRDVTIRPEMTPTVARMVAAKRKELTFPLRWYSIPNLWRYERPQRGRLREHWQFNCDVFGVEGVEADVEIMCLAYDILKAFGAKDKDFVIKINNRRLLNTLFDEHFKLVPEQKQKLFKLIDKFGKMPRPDFDKAARELVPEHADNLMEFLYVRSQEDIFDVIKVYKGGDELLAIFNALTDRGIKNFVLDFSVVRGFDYYTGTVFEVFDTNPVNARSLFGGGRYDDLVGIFGVEKVSGIGFGMGDVTTKDFLETHQLIPEYLPPVELYICHTENYVNAADQLARELRGQGVNVEADLTGRKVTAQVKTADREKIPYLIVVGEEEVKTGKFKVKSLGESSEREVARGEIAAAVKK